MNETPPVASFEDILTSAVSRQVEEQRGLRTSLHSVRQGIDEVRADLASAATDVQALAAAMLELNAGLRERFGELETRVGGLAEAIGQGLQALATTQQSALEELGSALSTALGGRLEETNASLGEVVAMAQGLSGLRDELERSWTSTSAGLGEVREELSRVREQVGGVEEISSSVVSELRSVGDRIGQSSDLVAYLRDQSEDVDRLITGLRDVPERVEGVLAQALRRALTVRAGLLDEAAKALTEALAPIESRVKKLIDELGPSGRGRGKEARGDEMRRVALGQVEIGSRLDQLQDAVAAIEEGQERRREVDLVLAQAIDRLGRGVEPDAAAGVRTAAAAPAKPARSSRRKGAKSAGGRSRSAAKSSRTTGTDQANEAGPLELAEEPKKKPQPSRRRTTYIPI